MKSYATALVLGLGILSLVPLTSANTNTGTSSSGTTYTGSWNGSGKHCATTYTGSYTSTGTDTSRMDRLVAQQAFVAEMSRLLTVKRNAYTVALTLSGTARVDAFTAANTAFRTGMQTATTTLREAKKAINATHTLWKKCQADKKDEKYNKMKHKFTMKSHFNNGKKSDNKKKD